jgi:hypothetical protein
MPPDPAPIRFESISGPPISPLEVSSVKPVIFGRSGGADIQLTDKTISRKHCRVVRRGLNWLLTDLESRHGTYLNGIRLEAEQPAPLADGDLVRIGPWTLRVIDDKDRATSMPTTNDLATTSHRVQRVPVRELRSVAQQRLDLLIECAAGINAATSERELASGPSTRSPGAPGSSGRAFIRQVSASGDVQILAAATPESIAAHERGETPFIDPSTGFSFSRSLINAASNGRDRAHDGRLAGPTTARASSAWASAARCAPRSCWGPASRRTSIWTPATRRRRSPRTPRRSARR